MAYRVVILGSGSRGNSLLVAGRKSRLLVDMGLSQRRIVDGLAAQRLAPSDLDALLVTHTHGDHVGHAAMAFCRRHGVPLATAADNLAVLRRRFRGLAGRLDRAGLLREIPPMGFHINGLDVRPFEVPHDAEGLTLGYHLTMGDGPGTAPVRMAVATDLGHVPPEVLAVLERAEVLVLESNHDGGMLAASGRPAYLNDRIAGPDGHLSNRQTAGTLELLLARVPAGQLRRVVLAHLSQECNEPQLARREIRRVLASADGPAPRLLTASQDAPLTVLSGRT